MPRSGSSADVFPQCLREGSAEKGNTVFFQPQCKRDICWLRVMGAAFARVGFCGFLQLRQLVGIREVPTY